MKLPHSLSTIEKPFSVTHAKWQKQFVSTGRKRHEGIWRRTQEPATAKNSGYRSELDARWKLVHFFDEYDFVGDNTSSQLVLAKPYLWWNTALPEDEADTYYDKTVSALNQGGWNIERSNDSIEATLGNLTAKLGWMSRETAEELSNRTLPENYKVIDCEVYGPDMHLSDDERIRPWQILRGGIRQKLDRGNPTILENAESLQHLVPFQLELGCGPSIEAGVPPLAHLHRTYAISNPKTHEFIIGNDDDLPVRFFSDPSAFYDDASLLYATAMKAEPTTEFYQSIKHLADKGVILNPVFTNNYDGLISDVGMTEYYMRRFEDAHVFPDVTFHPDAKALVVVGSHADRRKLQEQARSSGLQVVYVDPESYLDEATGTYYEYPIEAPQDSDLLYRMSAEQFAQEVLSRL